jgi:hypothetical protein
MNPRLRLILAAALFVAWIGWLGYAALTRSREPIVSHSQAAAADGAVVAEVEASDNREVEVVEKLWGDVPTAGKIQVVNLSPDRTRGFTGPGKYLLYLTRDAGAWAIVGPQRSPGSNWSNLAGPFLIYPWSADIQAQAEALKP